MFKLTFKIAAYLIIIALVILGLTNLKDKMYKPITDDDKEPFYDLEDKDEEKEKEKEADKPEKINIKQETSTCDKVIIDKMSSVFDKNFEMFKKKMNDQMDAAKHILHKSILESTKKNEDIIASKKGVDPVDEKKQTYDLYDNYETNQSDNEQTDEEDEEDTSFTENFVEEGMYDGITSPYCLNCREV